MGKRELGLVMEMGWGSGVEECWGLEVEVGWCSGEEEKEGLGSVDEEGSGWAAGWG